MKMKKLGLTGLLLTSGAILTLTGCGGDSDGVKKTTTTPPPPTTTPPPPTTTPPNLISTEIITSLSTAFSQATGNKYATGASDHTPIVAHGTSGISVANVNSVIQSDIADADNVLNAVGLGVDATKTTLNFTKVASGKDVNIGLDDSVESGAHTMGNNFLPVSENVYKESLAVGDDFFVVNRVLDYGDNDIDYVSFGLWAYKPQSGNGDIAGIGTYVDGGDLFDSDEVNLNLEKMTGFADYKGEALAVYNKAGVADVLTGDVTLRASFDNDSDAGRISGWIDNLTPLDADAVNSFGGHTIELKSADLSVNPTYPSWTDVVSVSNEQDDILHSGKWSGQFYGNGAADGKPEFAAGTFNSSDTMASGTGSFTGSFVAEKQ